MCKAKATILLTLEQLVSSYGACMYPEQIVFDMMSFYKLYPVEVLLGPGLAI